MVHRPFVPWPNAVLRQAAVEVETVDAEINALWDEMLEAMYAMPGQGVGLAAPQLGIGLRLAVVDARDGGSVLRMANPILISQSAHLIAVEVKLEDNQEVGRRDVIAQVSRG